MLISRKMAQCMWMSKDDFNKFWPLPESQRVDVVRKVWGSPEEANAIRAAIEKAHGIKLK